MNTIATKDGTPFKTAQAAAISAGRFKFEKGKFEIVSLENGGYAIQTEESVPDIFSGDAAPKKHRVTTSWKPATLLDIPKHLKDPDFVYRFCDKNRDGNIDKKIAEGWEIDKELSRKMRQGRPTLDDGAGLDTTLGIRELIVMRMPVETAEARRKYYAEKTEGAMKKQVDQLKKDLKDAAGEYDDSPEIGSIKVETY